MTKNHNSAKTVPLALEGPKLALTVETLGVPNLFKSAGALLIVGTPFVNWHFL